MPVGMIRRPCPMSSYRRPSGLKSIDLHLFGFKIYVRWEVSELCRGSVPVE